MVGLQEWVKGWMVGWMDIQIDSSMEGKVKKWLDGILKGRDNWTNGWMIGYRNRWNHCFTVGLMVGRGYG